MLEISICQQLADFELDIAIKLNSFHVLAIYGASGSGKSTLLRQIAGLERTTRGQIIYQDNIWQSDKIFVRPETRKIGMVFQEPYLFPHLNVEDNLLFADKKVEIAQFEQIISDLELEKLLQRMPNKLSGGEKQKVALARALLTKPQLLLLDEPFAAIDQATSLFLIDYLQQLDIPQILVSHSSHEVLRSADYVIHLANGKIIKSGMLNQMLSSLAGYTQYHLILNVVATNHLSAGVVLTTTIGNIFCPIWQVAQITRRLLLNTMSMTINTAEVRNGLAASIVAIKNLVSYSELTCQFVTGIQIIIPISQSADQQQLYYVGQTIYLTGFHLEFV